jgi:hypothetical protein
MSFSQEGSSQDSGLGLPPSSSIACDDYLTVSLGSDEFELSLGTVVPIHVAQSLCLSPQVVLELTGTKMCQIPIRPTPLLVEESHSSRMHQ